MGCDRQRRRGSRPRRDGARDLLPPRARPRHPVDHVSVQRHRCPQRRPGKNRLALEASRTIDAVLFDKTGTLTLGEHAVIGIATADGIDEADLLRVAGGVEADSEHPLARAIVAAARDRGDVATATDFASLTGRGVEATVDGTRHAVGGPALLRERDLTVPDELTGAVDAWEQRGAAVLHVVRGDRIIGSSPSKTRSAPKPARQSTSYAPAACASP